MRGILFAAALLSASPGHAASSAAVQLPSARAALRTAHWTPPGTLIMPNQWAPRLSLPNRTRFWAEFEPTRFEQSWPVRVFNYMNRPMTIGHIGNFRIRVAIIFE